MKACKTLHTWKQTRLPRRAFYCTSEVI